MWKCKYCGSIDIRCAAVGSFAAYGEVDEDGKLDTSTIDFGNIHIYEDDLEESTYFCEDCQSTSDNLDDIADWIEESD